jgi:hypothetical protein
MLNNDIDNLKIENTEKDVLFKFGQMFKDSLEDFGTSVDRSLGYLDKIVLPIIIASKQDKSYNPFSEIIEKFAMHILTQKLEKEGYSLLPLGYSSDLTLEDKNHILSIDIKTANIDNPSDFRKTIPIGINQMTHVAKLRLQRRFLPEPYYVYPTIPPFYKLPSGEVKLVLTYGLMFIYPAYKDLVDDIRNDYSKLFEFFKKKVKKILIPVVAQELNIDHTEAKKILESKPEKSRYNREELISESLIRGLFIYEQQKEEIIESLGITEEEKQTIKKFSQDLKSFTDEIRKRDIKPIAIIAISIPNGLLIDKYLDKFVSGKNYSKSARYHYEDGIFEIIKDHTAEEIPRVIFIDLNKNFLDQLKRYFEHITMLDYKLKRIK